MARGCLSPRSRGQNGRERRGARRKRRALPCPVPKAWPRHQLPGRRTPVAGANRRPEAALQGAPVLAPAPPMASRARTTPASRQGRGPPPLPPDDTSAFSSASNFSRSWSRSISSAAASCSAPRRTVSNTVLCCVSATAACAAASARPYASPCENEAAREARNQTPPPINRAQNASSAAINCQRTTASADRCNGAHAPDDRS